MVILRLMNQKLANLKCNIHEIITFLTLETTTIFFIQAADERNYHVFYQLCTARDLPEFEDLCLEHPDEFFYLNQGDSAEIEGLMGNDDKEFEATREAFKVAYRNKSQTIFVHIY